MGENWIAWMWVEAACVSAGAPLLSIYSAFRWQQLPEKRRRHLAIFGKTVVVAALLFWSVGISFVKVHANMAVLGAAYFVYCSFAAISLKNRRWFLGVLLWIPPVLAIALTTIGGLLFLFLIGDFEPRYDEMVSPKVHCRITGQGGATSESNYTTVRLFKTVPLLPIAEYRIFKEVTKNATPPNDDYAVLCRQAFARASR